MLRCLAVLVTLCVVGHASAAEPPKVAQRWAVLVGVDDYIQAEDLKFCGADQRALRDRLISAGFPSEQILLLEDKAVDQKYLPFKSNIEKQLDLVLGVVDRNDLVVVAFSGHGVHLEGKSFFCPKDADLEKPETLVALDKVYQRFDESAASLKVLVVDACRNDPRPPGRRSARSISPRDEAREFTRSLESVPEGVVLLNSCTAGEISWEDADFGHGVFMHYLLEGLDGAADGDANGRVSINELSRYANGKTKSHVVRKYNESQRPFLKGDLTIDVLDFEIAKGVVKSSVPTTPPTDVIPSNAKPGDVITNSLGMKLVQIPAGEFLMGSPDADDKAASDEKPQHRVRIAQPFLMGTTEVTQLQWFSIMETKPWRSRPYVIEEDDYPAVHLSWDDATEFCRKLTTTEGKAYRLPTEAEWEYACRAGTTTRYSFGDDLTEIHRCVWFEKNSYNLGAMRPHHAAELRPNAWGLFDMHGNVWEWCDDWYAADRYRRVAAGDQGDPESGSYHVHRGGAFNLTADACRSAIRSRSPANYRGINVGFRVVASP